MKITEEELKETKYRPEINLTITVSKDIYEILSLEAKYWSLKLSSCLCKEFVGKDKKYRSMVSKLGGIKSRINSLKKIMLKNEKTQS